MLTPARSAISARRTLMAAGYPFCAKNAETLSDLCTLTTAPKRRNQAWIPPALVTPATTLLQIFADTSDIAKRGLACEPDHTGGVVDVAVPDLEERHAPQPAQDSPLHGPRDGAGGAGRRLRG